MKKEKETTQVIKQTTLLQKTKYMTSDKKKERCCSDLCYLK